MPVRDDEQTCEEKAAEEWEENQKSFEALLPPELGGKPNGRKDPKAILEAFFDSTCADTRYAEALDRVKRWPLCGPALTNGLKTECICCEGTCECSLVHMHCDDCEQCPSKFYGWDLVAVISASAHAASMVWIPVQLPRLNEDGSIDFCPLTTETYAEDVRDILDLTCADPDELNCYGLIWNPDAVPDNNYCNPCYPDRARGAFVFCEQLSPEEVQLTKQLIAERLLTDEERAILDKLDIDIVCALADNKDLLLKLLAIGVAPEDMPDACWQEIFCKGDKIVTMVGPQQICRNIPFVFVEGEFTSTANAGGDAPVGDLSDIRTVKVDGDPCYDRTFKLDFELISQLSIEGNGNLNDVNNVQTLQINARGLVGCSTVSEADAIAGAATPFIGKLPNAFANPFTSELVSTTSQAGAKYVNVPKGGCLWIAMRTGLNEAEPNDTNHWAGTNATYSIRFLGNAEACA